MKQILKIVRDNFRYAKNHREQDKKVLTEKKLQKELKIVFYMKNPEVWNSVKTVYEAALNRNDVQVYLLAIPPYRNGKWDLQDERSYRFCLEVAGERTIRAYNPETCEWFALEELAPDYVVLDKPYNHELPEMYRMEKISQFTKICYIPYGYTYLNTPLLNVLNNPVLLRYASMIFADSDTTYQYCRNRLWLSEKLNKQRVYNIGYPRFDLSVKNKKSKDERLTVMWIPRWTLGESEKDSNFPSSFLKIKDWFVDFVEKNKNILGIIRPHPLMFEHYIEAGKMSREEVDEYKRRISDTENLRLDEDADYLKCLRSADILIADFSSIVYEFFVTGKPIIFIGKENQGIYDSFYHAMNAEQVQKWLEELLAGKDSKMDMREKQINRFLKELNGKAGKRILEVIIQDYYTDV